MPKPSHEAFPSLAQAGLLLLASILFQAVIGAGFYDARRALGLSHSQVEALVMLLGNGLVLAVVMHHRRMTYPDLLHPAQASAKATALLVIPPVLLLVPMLLLGAGLLNDILLRLLPLSLWEEQAFARMVEPGLASVIAACVLAPVLEEMLFRGVILRAFLHQYPRGVAISSSALYFGVAHLNVYQFALAFLLGLLLGWLFERFRSLLPCIALHAAYNSAVVLAESSGEGGMVGSMTGSPALLWSAATAAAVVGIMVLRRVLAHSPAAVLRREV